MNLEPKRPISGTWLRSLRYKTPGFINLLKRERRDQPNMPESEMYISPLGIQVISSVHVVENAKGGGTSPHYHVSISDNGHRVAASIVPLILAQFGASDFEEDNHAPSKRIRSFWKPVGRPPEDCACKENEKPEVDGDYVWRPS